MTRLYAIDASSVHYWLFHARPKDENGNEMPLDRAVAGWFAHFCSSVSPTHVAVCLDGKNNWRAKEHAEYKSTRKARPVDEELIAALAKMPTAWRAWGVPVFEVDTFEADDVIAALCNVHASPECEVVVVSSDKDLMQLVGDHVRQYDPRPDKTGNYKFYDAAAVEEKLKVPPHRVHDLLSLMGDKSDDVPGVAGWGETRAVNAIRQTSSMAELLRKAAAGELKLINENLQRRVSPDQKPVPLTEQLEELRLSQLLVSLRFDVPVPTDLTAFVLPSEVAA